MIEDDPGLSLALIDRLDFEGYTIDHIDNGDEAIKKVFNNPYELIILDIMLKGKNGFDICSEVRSLGSKIPILMLTALGQTEDKVKGFKLGADDYLTKPFEVIELVARIDALLRRSSIKIEPTDFIKSDSLELDLLSIEVKKNGQKIDLSLKEFQLLKYMILNRGRLLSRDELLNEVWGYEENPTTRTVDTHIGWLRHKIEDSPKSPRLIITVHGYGYKFVEEPRKQGQ